ncbi:hypothetical protein BU25DRAFT_418545 [Macroventuria anomochaeta]|uniref:Uncharacterized protein n=1 Tax=Macroventuria anomochaeta TaxID=301207 RepID=A0ACB6SEM7_9PLEO|nr:uncharacterized protein BU25DRAFT_418545 [Macroventuria anomochaeta]KAF2631793.1 hypothetical protein BU25DRAFT_418545 [Macroventuria anomochaeta]
MVYGGPHTISHNQRSRNTLACDPQSNDKPHRQLDHLTTSTLQVRPRAKSDAYPGHRHRPYTFLSDPQIKTTVRPVLSSHSPTSQSPPAVEHSKKRHRKRTPPSDSESERITGHVLASGKFQCSDPGCEDLRFGRQADFRRHYTNVHADKIIEYFCPVSGCERSRKPSKKSKGRSFNGRKDKMEEHLQTVHHKLNKKRRRSPETEIEEEEEEEEDAEEAEQPQAKTQRHF